jgi:hypothetical protein
MGGLISFRIEGSALRPHIDFRSGGTPLGHTHAITTLKKIIYDAVGNNAA